MYPKLLHKQELESFNYLKQRFYKELENGFYVYAKKKEKDNDDNNVDDCVIFIFDAVFSHGRSRSVSGNVVDAIINVIVMRVKNISKYMKVLKTFKWSDTMASIQTGKKVYELYGIKKKRRIKNLKERKKI